MFKGNSEKSNSKILLVLLAILFVFICISSTQFVLAENNGVTDPGYFEFNRWTGTITSYDAAGGLGVVIPSQIDGADVKRIGKRAFFGNNLITVEIPDSVEVIGEEAFKENDLTSVEIGDGVKEIGKRAFMFNDLISVEIPDSVEVIRVYAFFGNNLTSFEIGDGVDIVGGKVILGGSFKEVYEEHNRAAGKYVKLYGKNWYEAEKAAKKKSAKKEVEVKAYREINFEEFQATVQKKIARDPEIDLMSIKEGIIISSIDIAGHEYRLRFHFFQGQLYQISVISPGKSADYFDTTVKEFRDQLFDIIEHQYGNASLTREVRLFDVSSGYITWSHVWRPEDIGQVKEIKVGLSAQEFKYMANMYIQYPPLVEAKKKAEKEEKEGSTEETAEDF